MSFRKCWLIILTVALTGCVHIRTTDGLSVWATGNAVVTIPGKLDVRAVDSAETYRAVGEMAGKGVGTGLKTVAVVP